MPSASVSSAPTVGSCLKGESGDAPAARVDLDDLAPVIIRSMSTWWIAMSRR